MPNDTNPEKTDAATRRIERPMMTGKNELVLNEATMCEIVQHWLDSRMLASAGPRVTQVRAKGDPHPAQFEVTLESGDGE
jgi:hypothetical protein